jgi:D-beta-D-heptose 7-phosphate kinase / D-beta-D-heptose 1-phosphate adenosyltransferase
MIHDLHRVMQLIEGEWGNTRILVVGDVMLDRYIWGDVKRVSPEAPVPIVRALHRTEQPGGAANVAMNVTGLGAKATLFGFCGQDADRVSLEECLRRATVDAELTAVATHPTTTKLRIVGGKQQMLRLDTETTDGYSSSAYEDLIGKVEAAIPKAHALVLSDYAKGVLAEHVCQRLIQTARQKGIPILVDPKQRSFARYRHATTICPNLNELSVATDVGSGELDAILSAGQEMVRDLDLQYMAVTLSEKGIAVLTPN